MNEGDPKDGAAARRPRMRLAPRAAILAVVVMVLLLYMMVPLRSYLEQRTRLAQPVAHSRPLSLQALDRLSDGGRFDVDDPRQAHEEGRQSRR